MNVGRPEPARGEHRRAVCPATHSPMGTPRCRTVAEPSLFIGMISDQLHRFLFFDLFMAPLNRAGTRCHVNGYCSQINGNSRYPFVKKGEF